MTGDTDILSLGFSQLENAITQLGEPRFRAKQLFSWLHAKRVHGFEEMSDISRELRDKLAHSFYIGSLDVAREQRSSDGTRKYLFSLRDGNCIETVAMSYHHGMSVCVSTQVGCRMGCAFCASTKAGLVRSLEAGEILEQVYKVSELTGERVDSVVLMGIGEPLDNFENVCAFMDIVTDERGYNMAGRALTLSSCGLVPRIDELAAQKRQLTLSVSLHAASEQKRSEIMPINRKYPLRELIPACKRYFEATGRRVTFEYAVIAHKNDTDADARELHELVVRMGAHINLIPINPVAETSFTATRANAEEFRKKLEALGMNATLRRTLGSDISAACGQLRRESTAKSNGKD